MREDMLFGSVSRDDETVRTVIKHVEPSLKPIYDALLAVKIDCFPQIFSIEVKEGYLRIEEEYIDAPSLRELLERSGAQNDAFVFACASQICDALILLHSLSPSMIHRDIKPENVLFSEERGFVLIDFDAARFYRQGEHTDTVNLGTHGYAAPEQYGFSQTDPRTDIYSLGVLLFELKTGKHHCKGDHCPGKMGRIIDKCTQFDSEKRFSSAIVLKRALSFRKRSFSLGIAAAVLTAGVAAVLVFAVFPALQMRSVVVEAPPESSALASASMEETTDERAASATSVPEELETAKSTTPAIPCTCNLPDLSSEWLHIAEFSPASVRVKDGGTTVPLYAIFSGTEGCNAKEHEQPEFIFSLDRSTASLAPAIEKDSITVYQSGDYYIRLSTEYHGKHYEGVFGFRAYPKPEDGVFCTCTIHNEDSYLNLFPEHSTVRISGEDEEVRIGAEFVRDDEGCEALVHEEPFVNCGMHNFDPENEYTYCMKDLMGSFTVDGDIATITRPGTYYYWYFTSYHGKRTGGGYYFNAT